MHSNAFKCIQIHGRRRRRPPPHALAAYCLLALPVSGVRRSHYCPIRKPARPLKERAHFRNFRPYQYALRSTAACAYHHAKRITSDIVENKDLPVSFTIRYLLQRNLSKHSRNIEPILFLIKSKKLKKGCFLFFCFLSGDV